MNELLSELEAAHKIIQNALNIMTVTQKAEWAARNDRDGVIDEGTTRYHERKAVIIEARAALQQGRK